jgi:hypothetical protein
LKKLFGYFDNFIKFGENYSILSDLVSNFSIFQPRKFNGAC